MKQRTVLSRADFLCLVAYIINKYNRVVQAYNNYQLSQWGESSNSNNCKYS